MPGFPADVAPRDCLIPDWDAPASVRAFVTLRSGGVSRGAWGLYDGSAGGWNLGAHCGDAAADVADNRARLRSFLPQEPLWLEQVHGDTVLDADLPASAVAASESRPVADAAVSGARGCVLAVLTADCLPVLLTNARGDAVGIAHAGWRGLCAGVLENTVAALARKSEDHAWRAWLGPAIGPELFEVGEEVRAAFVDRDPQGASAFVPGATSGKWLGDLYALARLRLRASGVGVITGGNLCTVSEPRRFYSYRRDRSTGRMASLIWLR